jgi:UDP-N-acetylmuramoylalanine--D-glutamate ligase
MPSSPPRRWADLAGARVGIWGLGEEGRASRARLSLMGVEPVLVSDSPSAPSELALGSGGLDALLACDVVVKSPGVSRYRPEVASLESAGVAVVGGLGLWLEEVDRPRVIAVTGTKGKSTTVSIIGHLLRGLGYRCFVGGNIGAAPWAPDAPVGDDVDAWVIEVSSFQVTDLWSAPPVVAVTSLHPDHLDWHGSFSRYAEDKLALCTLPGVRHVVVNGTDPMLRSFASLLGPAPDWVSPSPAAWVGNLGLRGEHNRMNALIAAECLARFGVPSADSSVLSADALASAASGFQALPSRLESIGCIGGVEFVDDSLSTNVLPTIAAVSVFDDRRVALLVGGYDRQIDYAPLAAYLAARRAPLMVLTMPDSGTRIREAISAVTRPASLEVEDVPDLAAAVAKGFAWAQPDGVVLLSPAAPSFGRFANYAARAEAFQAAMEACR